MDCTPGVPFFGKELTTNFQKKENVSFFKVFFNASRKQGSKTQQGPYDEMRFYNVHSYADSIK